MFTMVKTKRLYEKEMKHRFHLQCKQILLLSLTIGYQNVFQSDIDYHLFVSNFGDVLDIYNAKIEMKYTLLFCKRRLI